MSSTGEAPAAQLASDHLREGLVNGKWDPIADLLDGAAAVDKTAGSLAYVAGK